jgi:hypothetical protein
MKLLTELANKFGTDKGSIFGEGHSYTEFYDEFFQQFKNQEEINILEVGVLDGMSLKMYNEYFNGRCNIYGLDIDNKSHLDTENIKTFIVDQGSAEQLDNFKQIIGDTKFDIIIDDGSHQLNHQQLTLYKFHDLLKPNGIYILEDLHTFVWGSKVESPLYSLVFNERFAYLSDTENDELREKINTVNIWSFYNKKSPYCNSSITSVITFKN